MIGSPEVDKIIRKVLSPVLRENGFDKVKTRNNWGYRDPCIWVLNIRAVGVHSFPSMSVSVSLGIYYKFISPDIPGRLHVKTDKDGKLIPKEWMGHVRNHLVLADLNQTCYTKYLHSSAEANRKDIWWIEPDDSNLEAVINDIKLAFLTQGMQWFNDYSNLEYAFKCIDFLASDFMVEDIDEAGRSILRARGHIYGLHAARDFAKYLNYQDKVAAYVAWEEKRKREYLIRVCEFGAGVIGTCDLEIQLELSRSSIDDKDTFTNSGFVFTRTSYPGYGPRWDKYWKMSKLDTDIIQEN